MTTTEIANLILAKLSQNKDKLKKQFEASNHQIGYFFLDDLLPSELALQIEEAFPTKEQMVLKKSLRENKYIGVQLNEFNPLIEKVIYAFQDDRIVKVVEEICQLDAIEPDHNLYAGGVSLMEQNQFLNPHLDNSHNKERNKWRVLNLLYYVSSDWSLSDGGNLELWPNGLEQNQITLVSKFNRLAVMATHNLSWHSVSPIISNKNRKCVSNYYFSENPFRASDSFHVTSFRARPKQYLRDKILQCDTFLRMNLRKIFKKGVVENPHYYKRKQT